MPTCPLALPPLARSAACWPVDRLTSLPGRVIAREGMLRVAVSQHLSRVALSTP